MNMRVLSWCAIGGLVAFAAPVQASPGAVDWSIAPYVWAINTRTDVQTERPPSGLGNETRFTELVDKFDGVIQVHAEGRGDRFGVFADFTYLSLEDGDDRLLFRTESELSTHLFEVAAFWHPNGQRDRGLDVFAGLRYIDMDIDARFIPANPSIPGVAIGGDEVYGDLMLGARYTWMLSDRWSLALRGDGSFGNTDGTWNASAVARYRTRNGGWLFGYRYLEISTSPNDIDVDLTVHGPMLGYAFAF